MNPSSIARLLGRRGGLARGRRLSSDTKKQIASLGGHARRESIEAARRIVRNLRYAATVRELHGGTPAIVSRARLTAPVPGVYRQRS